MTGRIAFLVLTTRCNRHCPYCFYETGYQDPKDRTKELSLDDRLLDALEFVGVDKLILTGGDPLLLPDLEQTVRRFTKRGFFTLLLSNGDLLNPDRYDRLVESGLGAISISLDDTGARKGSKAPWPVLEQVARDARIPATVITPITRANLEAIPEITGRVHSLGLSLLLQPVFLPQNSPVYATLSLKSATPSELERFESCIRKWSALFGWERYANLLLAYYLEPEARAPYCLMGTRAFVIDADGEVFPCFHRRELAKGNLLASPRPGEVLQEVFKAGSTLSDAPCFGEQCISLFSHL